MYIIIIISNSFNYIERWSLERGASIRFTIPRETILIDFLRRSRIVVART